MSRLTDRAHRRTRLCVTTCCVAGALLATGCHQDMYDQPKVKPLTESHFYADGLASRQLVEGTVPRGEVRTDELLYAGKVDGKFAEVFPFAVTAELVERGENRFNIYCSPCHGRLGNGRGMIVQRGFPQPRSFQNDTLKAAPVGYFFNVITNGYGRMYSYAPSVPVHDRWAIISYIRALQLSQNVPVSALRDDEQKKLEGEDAQ
jgi:mono/diheme cytochrome c family protein